MDVKTPATAVTVRGRGRLVGVDVAERICTVRDCSKRQVARGLCQPHYERRRTTGSVQADKPIRLHRPVGEPCVIDNCDRQHRQRGMCSKHYQASRRHLRPPATPKRRPSTAERFWPRVSRGDGCWVWQGTRKGVGLQAYGVMSVNGRQRRAHRIAWELAHGPIPAGMMVCHHCDNPPCVRPDHLFLGTAADNVADMCAKGRHVTGESTRRLSATDVLAIRERHRAGDRPPALAREFGVSLSTIHRIVRHEAWRHLP